MVINELKRLKLMSFENNDIILIFILINGFGQIYDYSVYTYINKMRV